MAKKYNPLQKAENIITVSAKLFLEKGYEKTSMQDIVENLGISKGAVFYHFKSKEDILHAVLKRQAQEILENFTKWIAELKKGNAREKIIAVLERNSKETEVRVPLDSLISSQLNNPRFIVANIQDGVNQSAPILAQLLREGVKDGSITTKAPDECAEVFLIMMNAWCDHQMFERDINWLNSRLKYVQQIMKQMGADILSDKLIKEYIKIVEKTYKGSKK